MKKIVSLLLLLVSFCQLSRAQNITPPEAVEYAKQGMKLFDEGKYSEAIVLYKKGKALAPSNSLFSYEIALSYFMNKDYLPCIETLDSVIGNQDANEQFYQLLGDSYDETGKPDTALIIYKKGMQKFPTAAGLSMESGVIEYTRKNYAAAQEHWITGVSMNPSYPENYYHLAKFYADSSNRIPAILFSETYLNLTRNTAQVAEINKLFCTLFTKSIQIMNDSTLILLFSDNNSGQSKSNDSVEDFCDALNNTMTITGKLLKDKKMKAGVDAVIKVRETIIKTWFEQKYNLRFPFSLFNFEKQIIEAGHFNSYSQWLLMKCNVFEFQRWVNENKKKYTDFVDWYKKNPIVIKQVQEFNNCR